MTDHSKTMAAFLIGAAAGTVLGVLFAPDKGDKTRSKLLKFANNKREELEDRISEGVDYAKRKANQAKDKVSSLGTEIEGKANELYSKAEEAKDKVKSEIEEAKGRSKQQYS
jgi:gas vesicle protein